MTHKGLWSDEKEKEFAGETRKQILKAFSEAEKRRKPSIDGLFSDVHILGYATSFTRTGKGDDEISENIS